MPVAFIEGWDFHRHQSGSNSGLTQDYENYWSINNNNKLTFEDGYSEGQAAIVSNPTGTAALVTDFSAAGGMYIPNDGQIQIHFWAKVEVADSGSTARPLVALKRGNFNSTALVVNCSQQGVAQLGTGGYLGSAGPSFMAIGSPVSGVFTNEWHFYRWVIDEDAKTMEFYKDGVLVLQGSGFTYTPESGGANLVFGRPTDSIDVHIDHIVVSDTTLSTDTNALHAVAVTSSWERFAETTEKFKGNLVINDKSHYTTSVEQTALSLNDATENYAPEATYLYPLNPETGAAWTLADLSTIQAFGVCSEGTFESGDYLRLTSIGLQTVVNDPETGFPIIKTTPPGAVVYLSGTWTKTDETKSYGAHLSDIPHTDLLADDDYLKCESLGCLLFGFSKVLQNFGITFAEEYRADFTDWVSVDGVGANYESYFVTGYNVLGEGNKKFQSNYVTVNYEDSDVSAQAYFQGVWDYALDGNTGRWSSRQAIYTGSEGNYKHFFRRLKVRGHGKALQFRVTSEAGKDFIINGWTVAASGNTSV